MAIVLGKADLSLIYALGIIDTLNVYIDDVLVASASDESSIQWAITIVEEQSQLNAGPFVAVEILPNETIDLSALKATYAPTILEGPSPGNNASVYIEDVTLYIPAETIDLSNVPQSATNASIPYITDYAYDISGSVFGAASSPVMYDVILSDSKGLSASAVAYTPTISEGASASAGGSVTIV